MLPSRQGLRGPSRPPPTWSIRDEMSPTSGKPNGAGPGDRLFERQLDPEVNIGAPWAENSTLTLRTPSPKVICLKWDSASLLRQIVNRPVGRRRASAAQI
jgi:hypothetical protein